MRHRITSYLLLLIIALPLVGCAASARIGGRVIGGYVGHSSSSQIPPPTSDGANAMEPSQHHGFTDYLNAWWDDHSFPRLERKDSNKGWPVVRGKSIELFPDQPTLTLKIRAVDPDGPYSLQSWHAVVNEKTVHISETGVMTIGRQRLMMGKNVLVINLTVTRPDSDPLKYPPIAFTITRR